MKVQKDNIMESKTKLEKLLDTCKNYENSRIMNNQTKRLDVTEKHDEMKSEGEIKSSRKRENQKNQMINTSKKHNEHKKEN